MEEWQPPAEAAELVMPTLSMPGDEIFFNHMDTLLEWDVPLSLLESDVPTVVVTPSGPSPSRSRSPRR